MASLAPTKKTSRSSKKKSYASMLNKGQPGEKASVKASQGKKRCKLQRQQFFKG
jgi:hypothetical protein